MYGHPNDMPRSSKHEVSNPRFESDRSSQRHCQVNVLDCSIYLFLSECVFKKDVMNYS